MGDQDAPIAVVEDRLEAKIAMLLDDFEDWRFEYQDMWWEQRDQRARKIRKSRQVGATVYFAREAFAKVGEAVLKGEQPRNQIFISASERQSLKFRREIYKWVRKVTGIELKGKIIELDFVGQYLEDDEGQSEHKPIESVGFYFLSTNSATAQGESGDFYFDEYAWVHGFAELAKVASGMATHKIYKKTFFSTPSTKTHEGYACWSGEEWNKGRAKGDQKPFDISQKNLRHGAIMPDGSWQQMLTIHDACALGLSALVDVDELRRECSKDAFRNLYECQDVDDAESSFPYPNIGQDHRPNLVTRKQAVSPLTSNTWPEMCRVLCSSLHGILLSSCKSLRGVLTRVPDLSARIDLVQSPSRTARRKLGPNRHQTRNLFHPRHEMS